MSGNVIRKMCIHCRGQFVDCNHIVTDLKTLDVNFYCSPSCIKQAMTKELKTWAKEKE